MQNLNLVKSLLSLFLFGLGSATLAQNPGWQQRVEYTMTIDMDDQKHQFHGDQHLVYYNNSPDTLYKVYYHLYFNAFQPGSMMDVRSRTIQDPDPRVKNRIQKLSPDEIGFQRINSLKQNGKNIAYEEDGTILVVTLNEPILPGGKATFDMDFDAQVPVQIRRSGRDNAEGVDYSMAQWYPKIAEYDFMGWHPNPYIAREFHGVWGDFDVKITIDADYTLGGTGYLQNPNEIGHGYESKGTKITKQKGDITWHFKAENVMDFVWAADKDYTHDIAQVPNGPTLHFLYQKNKETEENWKKLPAVTVKAFEYMNGRFGKYPYNQYSVIQGGDGGMEYPMATLITGERSMNGLVGVTIHELIHSWFQHLLGTNESLYPWMDEGFTTFASNETTKAITGSTNAFPHKGLYGAYFGLVARGMEEPSSLHSDHYNTNGAYSTAAYVKGAIFLNQLSYVVGQENFDKGMLAYFNTWKHRHPTPNDFIRIMEKQSGMILDWYLNYMISTTKTIDYGISGAVQSANGTTITLQKIGEFPMPIDLQLTYKDGSVENFYIPLRIMRNGKKNDRGINFTQIEDWSWTSPTYELTIGKGLDAIEKIAIDPSGRLADLDELNNQYIPGAK